jgi:uncharacterized protein
MTDMRLLRKIALLVSVAALLTASPSAAPPAFAPGNVVVYRVGTGVASLASSAQSVFLDEYTPAGTLVQSLALPTVASGFNRRLVASGTATSEGLLTRSADGQFLLVPGYDAALGTASIATTTSAATPRVVARINGSGGIDTSTALADWVSGGNPRGVASSNGTDLWVAGSAGGVRFTTLGSTTSTQLSTTVTNLRGVQIFDGQLYVSTSSGTTVRLGSVGAGLPTTAGQAITNLPGFPVAGSPYGFFLADLDAGVPGVDTLYVAADDAGALTKYSLVAGTWAANGTIGVASDGYRGLTATISGTTVTLFASRKGGSGATGGGELVRLVDATGYNGVFAGAPTVLATATANTTFRGIALTPGDAVATPPSFSSEPLSQTISIGTTATLTVVATGSAPLVYQWYQGASGITTTPVGLNAPTFTTPPLAASTSYWVRVSNSAGDADSAAATITTIVPPAPCSAADTMISAVQGPGEISPFAGVTATVQGVVVGDYEGLAALRGFYLQDLNPDGNPETSDGVFVFEASGANAVGLGQVVQVTGVVEEFQGQTEINASGIEACGEIALVPPTDVMLPVPAPFAGVAYLERVEGMLVRVPQTLYVTELFQLGRFGQVVMSANGRLPQPTSVATPGLNALAQQVANNLNRLVVDDDAQNQNPDPIRFGRGGNPLSALNTLRGGDTAASMVGVLTYGWGGNAASPNAYRLRPINALGGTVPDFQPTNPRPATPPATGGRLKIVGMNVLNYFLTRDTGQPICGVISSRQNCRGWDLAGELERQQNKLNEALLALDADIVGMAELENTQDVTGQDVNPLADIVARLNTSLGINAYGYVDTGVIGTDAIRVGVVYKIASVTPVGAPLVDNALVHNRPPVAQLFAHSATGERFTVVVNHFKSKGCSASSAPGDTDQGDGQGCFNATRVSQAQALLTFISGTVVPTTGDADVLLVGDFNAYAKEDPIVAIEAAGYTNLVARFASSSAYSYAFDGQWGYLDHALASASLLPQVIRAADYHINADEPSVLDYNINFKSAVQVASLYAPDEFRIADHDPVLVGLIVRKCDADRDGDIDAADLLTIRAANGQLASSATDPRDGNSDGRINVADMRYCQLRLANP